MNQARWDLRTELTEAAVEPARKSPVSRTKALKTQCLFEAFFFSLDLSDRVTSQQKGQKDAALCAERLRAEKDLHGFLM